MKEFDAAQRAPNQLSPEREQQLIDAARDVFIEKGVAGATIDLIAKRARINKVTIYRRYKNKFDLFEAVILQPPTKTISRLADLQLDPERPRQSLREAAMVISRIFEDSDRLETVRLMIAEARRHREVCLRARDQKVLGLTSKLVAYFEDLVRAGRMESGTCKEAAVSFVLLFSGGLRPFFDAGGAEEEKSLQFESDFAMFVRGNGISNDAVEGSRQ